MLPTLAQDAFFTQFGESARHFKSATGQGLHYSISGSELRVGFQGPFWQFGVDDTLATQEALTETIKGLISSEGKTSILVRSAPEDLYPNEAKMASEVLLSLGFSIDYTEIEHFVTLTSELESGLSRTNQKRVRRGAALGYTLDIGSEWLHESHSVISKNREQLGKPSAISLGSKEILSQLLGRRTIFGVVKHLELTLAGLFCLYLDDEVVYVAQWGDDRDIVSSRGLESPMPFLFSELGKILRDEGVKHLYLGTSSNLGNLDPGLARFKESLGCQRTNKSVWRLDI